MSTFLTTGALKEDVVEIISSTSSLALNPFSPAIVRVVGSTTQLITLPDATKLVAGVHYVVINDSVGTVTIEDFTATSLVTLETGYFATLYLLNAGTTAGVWATASLTSVATDKNLKLIGGGIWSWDLATDTLSSSSYAYVIVPGLSPIDNAIASGSFVIPAGEVAYVALSGLSGGPDLTVQTALPTAIPTNSNILIIAYRDGTDIIVGNSSFKLIDGQSGYLDLGLSIETQTLLGTSVTSATSTPDWISRGAPTRTIPNTNSGILDAVASIDTEFDKYFGQLRIIPHATFADNIDVTGSDRLTLTGEILSQELGSMLLDFSGATVDFTTGTISTGLNFTPATIPVGEYLWYCLVLEYTGTNALGQATARMQVIAATASNSNALLAPYPKFPALFRSRPLGMVQVYNDAGTITVYQLRQLGVGGGSGGSGGGNVSVTASTAILRGYPITINSSGEAEIVNITDEDSSYAFCGVTSADCLLGEVTNALTSGSVLYDIPVAFGLTGQYGKQVFVSHSGSLTITKPDIGVGGFVSEDFIVSVGVLTKNTTTGTTDLILNPQIRGRLA
jgi:hypothetical protein